MGNDDNDGRNDDSRSVKKRRNKWEECHRAPGTEQQPVPAAKEKSTNRRVQKRVSEREAMAERVQT